MRYPPRILIASFALLIAAFAAFDAGPVRAATTRCVNEFGTNGCFSSIETAVQNSNAGDTINVAGGEYQELVTVDKNLTITGVGAGGAGGPPGNPTSTLIIMPPSGQCGTNGCVYGPPFTINAGVTATLQNMEVAQSQAKATGHGGGIVNSGTLTLNDVFLESNESDQNGGGLQNAGAVFLNNVSFTANADDSCCGGGGGLSNSGTATLNNVTFNGNGANNGVGGAIYNSGTLNVTNAYFAHNTVCVCAPSGGGIYTTSTGTATLINVTFDSNNASQGGGVDSEGGTLIVRNGTFYGNQGGGINVDGGTANLSYLTFFHNRADSGGAAISNRNGTVSLGGSVLGLNPSFNAPSNNCSGLVTSVGYNVADDASCNLSAAGDLQNQSSIDSNLGSAAEQWRPDPGVPCCRRLFDRSNQPDPDDSATSW